MAFGIAASARVVAAQVIALEPFRAQDHFPMLARHPEQPCPGTEFEEIVEIVAFDVPGNVLDGVGIDGGTWTDLEESDTFMGLSVANPTGVPMVIGKICADVREPIAAPDESIGALQLLACFRLRIPS